MSTSGIIEPQAAAPAPAKKKLIRRTEPDRSQRYRLAVQLSFIALNVFLALRFYFWVSAYETGTPASFQRPAGVDGWLPIAGLMNTRYLFGTGHLPTIHPAAAVLFLTFGVMSLLMKKAFCSWLCPIGTLSEYLWKVGRKLLGRNLQPPRWIDIPLRALKYALLAFFVVFVGKMSVDALEQFLAAPQGLIADVQMLNFFRHMGETAMVVIVILVMASLLVKNFWCRYLCPYGALMSLLSLLSPVKIRRDQETCIDCAKCAKACPQSLPVDKLVQVRSAECSGCMECVAVCPAQNALQLSLPPEKADTYVDRWKKRAVSPIAAIIVLGTIFFGAYSWARITHHWQTNVPEQAYIELLQRSE